MALVKGSVSISFRAGVALGALVSCSVFNPGAEWVMYDGVSCPLCAQPTQPIEHVGVKSYHLTPSPLGAGAHKRIEVVGGNAFTLLPFFGLEWRPSPRFYVHGERFC